MPWVSLLKLTLSCFNHSFADYFQMRYSASLNWSWHLNWILVTAHYFSSSFGCNWIFIEVTWHHFPIDFCCCYSPSSHFHFDFYSNSSFHLFLSSSSFESSSPPSDSSCFSCLRGSFFHRHHSHKYWFWASHNFNETCCSQTSMIHFYFSFAFTFIIRFC